MVLDMCKGLAPACVLVAVFLIGIYVLPACTQNSRAKNFGGTETITLPAGQVLVTATWKDNHPWYLTRDRKSDETPTVYNFKEKISFGVLEGAIVFIEK